ncbi:MULTISPECIES: hypothetical protein [unclassified Campylobacter]|nr:MULTISPECIES: hypothetical protein [unclassified Campylobacter]MDA3078977.1 hypothetical protein [Campylobacter sp. CS_NA2]MDA3080732.1 hypothetical protein [Campylobacter sp. CS_NA1]MDA3089840.1 hypothetical protein [Campylobacter sp. CS_ED2]WBR51603.1 hypothetical protein PF026_01810 [Campylobacter sp. CS_NA3]
MAIASPTSSSRNDKKEFLKPPNTPNLAHFTKPYNEFRFSLYNFT